MENTLPTEPVNEYEAQRAARIAANKQRMEELGVLAAAQQLNPPKAPRVPRANSSSKSRSVPPEDLVATRASKRIKGESTPAHADITHLDQEVTYSNGSSKPASSKVKRDPSAPRFEVTDTVYAAPFYLTSMGITVHALGEVYRGPFSSNYWSSKGSLYRHIYPVGYHASKEAFGRIWDMRITAGDGGPVFTVSERDGTRTYSGPSATRPWTDVCLAFRPGQRISGPLYYGFSDLHVQRALAAMYTPAELSLALYGPNPAPSQPAVKVEPLAPTAQQQQQQQQQQHPSEQKEPEVQPLQPLPPHKQVQQTHLPSRPALTQAAAAAAGQAKASGEHTSCNNSRAPSPSSGPSQPAFELTSTQYAAPFALAASGVTVHELGQVYRGPYSFVYWSPTCSKYRHAYPVGYRASKEAFGQVWEMNVAAGAGGPIFSVSQKGSELRYIGPSPNCPWSDICFALRTGTMVSGSEYFGFEDLSLQQALAALYTPAELSFALNGAHPTPPGTAQQQQQQHKQVQQPQQQALHTAKVLQDASIAAAQAASSSHSCDSISIPLPLPQQQVAQGVCHQQQQQQTELQEPSQQHQQPSKLQVQPQQQQQQPQQVEGLSAAETFAAELQCVKGIGPATAKVLALTSALGGSRHTSLHSLCAWLAVDSQHKQQLQDFLTTSEEVPRCSRQLPAWRDKWVPAIVQQLAQLAQLY